MKKLLSLFVALCLGFATYGQVETTETITSDLGDIITLPAVVIKKAGKDFSIYLPEIENNDLKIQRIENAFVAYDLGKDLEGYNEYFVTLSTDDGYLAATYDENGKLTRVVEKYKNVKLPPKVVSTVIKNYPEWTIVKDKYIYTQEDGDIIKKQYDITLSKDNARKLIKVNAKGDIIKP